MSDSKFVTLCLDLKLGKLLYCECPLSRSGLTRSGVRDERVAASSHRQDVCLRACLIAP